MCQSWSEAVSISLPGIPINAILIFAPFFHVQGPMNFKPTYRWEKQKDDFSNKRFQSPSWTDRILFHHFPNAGDIVQTELGAQHHIHSRSVSNLACILFSFCLLSFFYIKFSDERIHTKGFTFSFVFIYCPSISTLHPYHPRAAIIAPCSPPSSSCRVRCTISTCRPTPPTAAR